MTSQVSQATDTLAYKFEPAGHNAPKQKRDYAEPDRRLRKTFEEWLEGCSENRSLEDMFLSAFRGLLPSVHDSHSLLVAYQDHPNIRYEGLFISALYVMMPDSAIVYDLDIATPPACLGFNLPAGKVLVACGNAKVGGGFGLNARGTVIASGNAKVGNTMGQAAEAPVIVSGNAQIGDYMGTFKAPIIISGNAQVGKQLCTTVQYHFTMARDIPELQSYCDELDRMLSGDYRQIVEALEKLGPEPGNKIKDDINQILRRSGYDV